MLSCLFTLLLFFCPGATQAAVSSTTISVSATSANPGATVAYTLTINSTGTTNNSNVATSITFTGAAKPAGNSTTPFTVSSSSGNVTIASYNGTSGVLSFTTSSVSVPNNGSLTITLQVALASPLATGATLVGNATANSVSATVPSGQSNTVTINNAAPKAAAVSTTLASTAGRTLLTPFSATEPNSNEAIASYNFTVPSTTLGAFYLTSTSTTPLSGAQVLTSNTLYFQPSGTSNGTLTFNYTATNNAASPVTSSSAVYTINVSNAAPTAAPVAATVNNDNTRQLLTPFSATDADGNTISTYNFTLPATGTFYTSATGGTALTPGVAQTLAASGSLYYLPSSNTTTATTISFSYTATDNGSPAATSAAATYSININAPVTISGRVFEDVNYGGGSGVDYTTANASAAASGFAVTQTGAGATDCIGRGGVRVELYRLSNGAYVYDKATLTSTVGTNGATTNGLYSFTNLAANTAYTVRVVVATVSSVRGSGTLLMGVPTYVGAGSTATEQVGGTNPALADAGSNQTSLALSALSNAQVIYPLTTGSVGTTTTDINFGFNFDVVVNTNNTGYGSLRQFLTNAVGLSDTNLDQRPFNNYGSPLGQDFVAGQETSIFMIPGGVVLPGLRSGLTSQLTNAAGSIASSGDRRALITLTSAFLTLSATNTVVDGTTQTTLLNSNTGLLGTGGVVGRQQKSLAQVERPEIEIAQATANLTTFTITANNNTLRGFAIHGGTKNVSVTGATTGFLAEGLLVGIDAFALQVPANPTTGDALYLMNYAGTVRGSIIAYAGNSGLKYSNGKGQTGSGYTITQNEFVENGRVTAGGDAMSFGDVNTNGLKGAGPLVITENLVRLSNSSGIQFEIGSISDNIVRNNTITNNGEGGTTSRLEGSGIHYLARNNGVTSTNVDLIEQNIITSNQSSGIVANRGQTKVRISQNSIYDNGSRTDVGAKGLISIDFTAANRYVGNNANGGSDYGQGDGVTPNDGRINYLNGAAFNDQPNAGIDYPVLTSIGKTADGKLRVTGYVGSASGQSLFGGAIVEIFSANNVDANQNGPTVVGGTDNVAHGEAQTYIGTLTAAADGTFDVVLDNVAAPINVGDNITATAYLPAYGTSEAGVNQVSTFYVPLPVELTAFKAVAKGATAELRWRTASEKNNAYFEVERGVDGKHFVAIGQVQGHGSTTDAHTYTFTDQRAAQQAGLVYYRLKQVDTDGRFQYSPVEALHFASKTTVGNVALYPNPGTSYSTLDLRALPLGTYQAMIVDLTGRTVQSMAVAGGTQQELKLQNLPAGAYQVLIRGYQTHLNLPLVKR